MYKREAAKVKCYQVVGYFQAKSRVSILFLMKEIQLFIFKRNYFDPFRGFLYNQNLKKRRSRKKSMRKQLELNNKTPLS